MNNLFTIPWPKELRELLKIFGTLNLDFLDFDAAGAWIGRSMHYCTVTLGLCVAFMFLLFGVFASHRWLLAPCVLRRDKAWGEQKPRELLLKLFESLGNDSELTKKGRRKLSNYLLL